MSILTAAWVLDLFCVSYFERLPSYFLIRFFKTIDLENVSYCLCLNFTLMTKGSNKSGRVLGLFSTEYLLPDRWKQGFCTYLNYTIFVPV